MQFFLSEQRNFCATGETRAPGINHRDHHFLQVKSLYLDTIVASSKFLLTGGALLDEPSLPWRELFGQPSEALAGALRDGKFKAALENITPVGSELREPYGWQSLSSPRRSLASLRASRDPLELSGQRFDEAMWEFA